MSSPGGSLATPSCSASGEIFDPAIVFLAIGKYTMRCCTNVRVDVSFGRIFSAYFQGSFLDQVSESVFIGVSSAYIARVTLLGDKLTRVYEWDSQIHMLVDDDFSREVWKVPNLYSLLRSAFLVTMFLRLLGSCNSMRSSYYITSLAVSCYIIFQCSSIGGFP